MGKICRDKKEFFDKLVYIMSDGEGSIEDMGKEKDWMENFDLGLFFDEYYCLDGGLDRPDVGVDFENVGVGEYCKGGLAGLGVTPSGYAYLAFDCGGDWECPLTAVLYMEDGHVRIYVPERGNYFNVKTRRAYGNEEGEEELFRKAKYNAKEELADLDEFLCSIDTVRLLDGVEMDERTVKTMRKTVLDAVKSCDAGKLLKIYRLIRKED